MSSRTRLIGHSFAEKAIAVQPRAAVNAIVRQHSDTAGSERGVYAPSSPVSPLVKFLSDPVEFER